MSAPSMKSIGDRYGTHSVYCIEHYYGPRVGWHRISDPSNGEMAWWSREDAFTARENTYQWFKKAWHLVTRRKDFRVRLYARVEVS